MKDWICIKCQHEVLSNERPTPIKWTDGHVCDFILQEGEIQGYQVLNRFGNPASNDFDDLCIFPKQELAESFIEYLKDCGLSNDINVFKIRPVTVVVSDRLPWQY